jgi:hypothetical protein
MKKMNGEYTQDVLNLISFGDVLSGKVSKYPGLVGFYESFEIQKSAGRAIELFLEFFSNELNGCFLYSTMTNFPGRNFGLDEGSMLQSLCDIGVCRLDLEEENITNEFLEFYIDGGSLLNLEALFKLVFAGLTDGYVFLFFKNIELVVYPHKYGGFGFLTNKKSLGEKKALQFLDMLSGSYSDQFLIGLESNNWADIYKS